MHSIKNIDFDVSLEDFKINPKRARLAAKLSPLPRLYTPSHVPPCSPHSSPQWFPSLAGHPSTSDTGNADEMTSVGRWLASEQKAIRRIEKMFINLTADMQYKIPILTAKPAVHV
jgi:hypothetical protein